MLDQIRFSLDLKMLRYPRCFLWFLGNFSKLVNRSSIHSMKAYVAHKRPKVVESRTALLPYCQIFGKFDPGQIDSPNALKFIRNSFLKYFQLNFWSIHSVFNLIQKITVTATPCQPHCNRLETHVQTERWVRQNFTLSVNNGIGLMHILCCIFWLWVKMHSIE